ncbi:MAG: DUF2268 domain-containing putative Zn-dependent protease [Psychroserpens sp.]|uniref:gliding motility protein GldB-related protein n=1 Tax=Psychroserpens sp. TaxID=2020870 RepID=UPI0030039304
MLFKTLKMKSFRNIKYTSFIQMILFFTIFLSACKENNEKTELIIESNKSIYESDPKNAQIITTDIDLFWNAYDQLLKDTLNNSFQKEYLNKGSIGLQDIINTNRIESAEALKQLVLSEQDYYNNIRASTYKSKYYEKQIRATHYALKYLYPEAVFPPVYLVIGRTTGIGMDTKNGLVITVETLSENNYVTNYGRPTFDLNLLPFVVAHEIIHFLQKDNITDETLLKHCIREGSADFISEMTSGEKVKLCNGPNVYSYGNLHEEELWNEFKKNMYTTVLSPWLYSQVPDSRPQNLGYWMGYKIVQAYYTNASDKRKAIEEILNITDYSAFFELSKYGNKFE